MIGWKRLRTRLVATYVLLAFLLLGSAGLVFGAALTVYATQVQSRELSLALGQTKLLLGEAMQQGQSAEALRQRLEQLLPGWDVTMTGPDMLLPKGLDAGPVLAGPDAKFSSVLINKDPQAGPVVIYQEAKPGLVGLMGKETAAFSFPLPGDLTGKKPATLFRISMKPSGLTILKTLMSRVLITLGLALCLAVVTGWWFSRWIARPLLRLTDATAAVAGGDFLQTVQPVGIEEIDRLGTQFNAMVLRLRESFRSLAAERDVAKRFAADAAHELRTPITALRTYQEVAAEHPERTPQIQPAIARQVARLERVIHGLLQMASLGEGTRQELVPQSLGEAVGALAPGLQAMAEECGHTFTLNLAPAEPPLAVRLDAHLLEQILYNLVDNACKYTPPGGRIEVSVEPGSGSPTTARLKVRDNGPGIAAEELPHIFRRFHRGIETQDLPGSGLGLAIVQEAAGRLGGTVSAESTPGAGSIFTVELPLAGLA